MRRLLPLFLLLLAFVVPLRAATTPAERVANEAAQRELDSSPKYGNIPSYSLKPADLAKGQHLDNVGNVMHFGGAILDVVALVLLLSLGAVRYFQNFAVAKFRNRWLQCVAFLVLFSVATGVIDLPLGIYGHWLRLKYGLSVQGWASWAGDQLKEAGISLVIGTLLVMLLFWFIRKFPRGWWFGFWIASLPITLLGIFLTPHVIDPLFNKFEPLQQSNPALVQRLEEVAKRGNMDIPPERMFLMKASEKNTTLNAYVTGFGASSVWWSGITRSQRGRRTRSSSCSGMSPGTMC
jgi:STE24 endopeptidase